MGTFIKLACNADTATKSSTFCPTTGEEIRYQLVVARFLLYVMFSETEVFAIKEAPEYIVITSVLFTAPVTDNEASDSITIPNKVISPVAIGSLVRFGTTAVTPATGTPLLQFVAVSQSVFVSPLPVHVVTAEAYLRLTSSIYIN
ncbi:MAG: Uncharacterised protein [Flavobacteriaceae bacterium]|nr:MAG: Uncharacterised protein [Flavobacteriaceae bacterium]